MMNKEDKKIIKYINKNKLESNTAYRDPVSGRFYITDSKGKFKNFTTEEEAIAYKDQKNLEKKFKEVVEDEKVAAYKKERKTKKKLQEVKKDPTLAQEALEKAYKNYDELVTKIEDAEAGSLSFLHNPKYEKYLTKTEDHPFQPNSVFYNIKWKNDFGFPLDIYKSEVVHKDDMVEI